MSINIKFPQQIFYSFVKLTLVCAIALAAYVPSVYSQSGSSNMEPIDAGALIIAMDNTKQGPGSGCSNSEPFNLRAYGLAVRLLHNNIPLKWSIANKGNKDDVDFTADATRITGSTCQNGGVNTSFSGGPLIIPADFAADALPFINTFNGEITGSANDVRVYQVNSGFVAPIRYTLTHKPLIAVGPDGGGFGSGIHQDLYDRAKLRDASNVAYYSNVNNENISQGSCYTIATQAHAADTAVNFISSYRSFAENGGNLLLQCYSVDVFENNAPFGHFQTTNGWTIFGTNPSSGAINEFPVFPNPAMPYNQFVGEMGNQDGRVTEYQFANNSVFQNGTLIAARNNSPGNANKYIATVSRIGNATSGGNVFELGGHDYSRTTGGGTQNTPLGRVNGERMILNAILVPATRSGCGLSIPSVKAFKTVSMLVDNNNNGSPDFGDSVEWSLRYINDGTLTITGFQVSDPLDNRLTYVPSLTVTATAGSSATANAAYNGVAITNMLSSATLAPGGMITIKVKTSIHGYGTILNQGTGTGAGIPSGGVKTDTADNTTPGTVAGFTIACASGCLPQNAYQTGSDTDPTGIDLGLVPSAAPADVQGRVVGSNGRGLSRMSLILIDATTGESRTSTTNTFGYFRFTEVPTGEFYVLRVFSKSMSFEPSSYSFTLNDNLSGVTFTGSPNGR